MLTILLSLLMPAFSGCSEGNEPMPDIEIPDEEFPEEDTQGEAMERAMENLAQVEEAMSPFFLETTDANALGQHLEEIKQMEGVEDAYVCDETTFAIKIKEGGMVYYYYPPEPYSVDFPEILDVSTLQAAMTKTNVCENKKVLIINQLSNDYRFEHALDAEQTLEKAFIAKGYSVKVVSSENFTAETLCEEMPKYGVTFLMTHGGYNKAFEGAKKTHFILTGEKKKDLKGERLKKWQQAWLRNEAHSLPVKNKTASGEYIEVQYVAVNESYLQKNIETRFAENSILFNVACRSLYANTDLWDVLKAKGLGCYLGLDGINSIGIDSGKYFFLKLLQGGTVDEAYNALSFDDKHELLGLISLECHPSNCPITLFDELGVTDAEAVDLGLSVKWRSMNLGAANYLELGNMYKEYDFTDIRYESPELLEDENDMDIDISGTKYDHATIELGKGWRTPNIEELEELKEKCKWEPVIMEEIPGFHVTGPNGNSIFLPCLWNEPIPSYITLEAFYWSSVVKRYDHPGIYLVGQIAPFASVGTQEIMDYMEGYIRPVCE